ncbi:pLS20_p028 family conjugation system transmembrane protein [Fructobacillus fructosus]|uniref:DUF8208 domain-containing protein n=1 Tax=Fructobacillus fructosus TaxID=1631 RepID=A0ABN9YX08_9LACO|nr:hypothetical protein R54839_PPFHFPJH_01382 [Fructobacillus fructosus]
MENLPSFSNPNVTFYQSWSDYLAPYPRLFMQIAQWFLYGISIILYSLGKAVQTAYMKTFEFFSFGGIFLNPSDPTYQAWGLGKIAALFLYAGIVALVLYMGFKMLQLMWTGGKKGREFPKGVVLTLATLVFLGPLWGIVSRTAPAIVQDLVGGNNQSIQTKLWANNSTNLYDLASHKFDASTVKDSRASINDEDIRGPLYKSLMTDGDYEKKLGKDKYQVFQYKLGADKTVQKTTGSKLIGGDLFRDEYPVMKVNWLGIILGEVVFIIVTFFAIIKVVKAIYILAFYIGSSVYFGLRDGTEGKRVQEILKQIEGEVTAIVLSPVSLIFFFAWIDFAFNLLNNWNLDTMTFAILSIGVLIGGLAGLDKGFSLIEGWTGTTTKNNPMANIMGAQMAARGLGGIGRKLGSTARTAISTAKGDRNNKKHQVNEHGKNADDDGNKVPTAGQAKSNPDGQGKKPSINKHRGAKAAKNLGAIAGVTSHPIKTAKSAGKAGKNAALDAARAGKDAAVDKAKSAAKNVKDYGKNLQDSFSEGHQAAKDFADQNPTGKTVSPDSINAHQNEPSGGAVSEQPDRSNVPNTQPEVNRHSVPAGPTGQSNNPPVRQPAPEKKPIAGSPVKPSASQGPKQSKTGPATTKAKSQKEQDVDFIKDIFNDKNKS